MNVEKDKVVQFSYRLFDEQDKELESSESGEPVTYLHGHNGLLPALEAALNGKQIGENIAVTLQPADAYGEIKADQQQRVPVKHLQGAKKWKKGMLAIVETEQGQRQVTIEKVGKFMATVDFNHPFAGKVLKFEIQVETIRDASGEEIAHGHVHGPGGHHH